MPPEPIASSRIADEIFLDHVGHFVRDPEVASARLRGPDLRRRRRPIQVNPDPAGGAAQSRPAPATSPPCWRAAISRCCSRRPTPRSASELDHAMERYAGVHLAAFAVADAAGAASPAFGGRLSHARAGRHGPPGRDRRGSGNGGLHASAALARRNGGRPHADAHPPHRSNGVAAALALAPQRRARRWRAS